MWKSPWTHGGRPVAALLLVATVPVVSPVSPIDALQLLVVDLPRQNLVLSRCTAAWPSEEVAAVAVAPGIAMYSYFGMIVVAFETVAFSVTAVAARMSYAAERVDAARGMKVRVPNQSCRCRHTP